MEPYSQYREIIRGIENVRNDREHGASFLARESLRVLALAAELSISDEQSSFALKNVASQLARARPPMAAIKTMARRFVAEIERREPDYDSQLIKRDLLREMESASMKAARNAAEVVQQGARVLTCSYSSAVLRSFAYAREAGRTFRVLAVESKIGEVSHGRSFLKEATTLGISADLVRDDSIAECLKRADMVLVGVDAILPDGSAVNGWPTRELAELARDIVPFFVVGESFKRDTEAHVEEGFELVPGNLITRTITD